MQAGNTSDLSNVVTVNIDKTAPTISAAATTSPNAAGWYNGDVIVHFTCSDSGSGISTCPADQVLSTEGTGISSTAQTATDAAGNTSDPSNVVTVNIDKTKPTISAAATTSPNAAGWYNSNVIVHFTCSDSGSGISTCPADQVLSTEGTGISSTAQTATDAAGNTSDPATWSQSTLTRLPQPSILPSRLLLFMSMLLRRHQPMPVIGPPALPSNCGAVNTSSAGQFSVGCTATDNAGNTANATLTYTVSYKVCALYDQPKPTSLAARFPSSCNCVM